MIILRDYRQARRRARWAAARGHPAGVFGGPMDWLRWSIESELQSAWTAACVAFDRWAPLPAPWDVALSRRVRSGRRWPQIDYDLPGCCAVCDARWHAGRCLRNHPACWRAIERAGELALQGREK
ncbi:hypothetical protein [Micromonospora sp. NPDC047730]|uniref:hypothetical protein n=1 Tax=Micromonospora sp. NPDC047730 TaxID=3364253 RepID=UPI003717B7F2